MISTLKYDWTANNEGTVRVLIIRGLFIEVLLFCGPKTAFLKNQFFNLSLHWFFYLWICNSRSNIWRTYLFRITREIVHPVSNAFSGLSCVFLQLIMILWSNEITPTGCEVSSRRSLIWACNNNFDASQVYRTFLEASCNVV
jgi:hypothetical protein